VSFEVSIDSTATQTTDGVILRVHVQPKASRERAVGLHGGRLKISVRAPADRGAANAAVTKLIATLFSVSTSDVTLVRGPTSRQKDLLISGATLDAVNAVLNRYQ
jgi:uncharacterized protein